MFAIAGGIVLAVLILSLLPEILIAVFVLVIIVVIGLTSFGLLWIAKPVMLPLIAVGFPMLILGYIGKRVLSYHGKERREALIGVVLCAPIVAPAIAIIVLVVMAIVREGLPALSG
ncbi:MAG TPA: hypothetical protein VGF07_13125 [Stellaceae bacterium]|jgi:hypothetical protein